MLTLVLLLSFFSPTSFATQDNTNVSPIGHWLTYDDKTNQPRGIIKIYQEKDGTLAENH